MDELKPCWFCGAAPVRNGRAGAGGVVCRGTTDRPHLVQTYGATQAEADEEWNRRPAPSPADAGLVAELRRMEEALRQIADETDTIADFEGIRFRDFAKNVLSGSTRRLWDEGATRPYGTEPLGCPTPGACSCPLPARIEALSGEYERGVEDAARWHDERYRNTPDAFEMEFHDVSRKAIRTLKAGGGDEQK